MNYSITKKLFAIQNEQRDSKNFMLKITVETPQNTFNSIMPIKNDIVFSDHILLEDVTVNNDSKMHFSEVYIKIQDIIVLGYEIVSIPTSQ